METTLKRGGLKLTSIRRILKFLQVDPGPARKFVNWFIRHYSRLLEERRVRLTPAMVMLGEDICAHYILLSRRYQLLNRIDPVVASATTDFKAVGAVFDDVLKLRERLRKSIGEFQSTLESAGMDPESALDEFLAGGGFDEIIETVPAADADAETAGLPLTDIRPDVQAVQPPDATPEVVVSPMSTVSTMSTMSTLSTEKESANDDTSLEPGRGESRNAAGNSDAPVAGPVRRKAPARPIRESLVRAWLSSRVARVPSQKEGALLGPGRGQDDRDRDPVRVGVGVPAVPADAGGGAARGAPGPADAADPEHVRAKPAASGQP